MRETISEDQAEQIRQREAALNAWLGKRNSYRPEELPSEINPPTNEERSALEIFDFCNNRPVRYFFYVDEQRKWVTTWTGDRLGFYEAGAAFRSNMGDLRVPIRVTAINGRTYSGTYYKSAGSYARVRAVRA